LGNHSTAKYGKAGAKAVADDAGNDHGTDVLPGSQDYKVNNYEKR
jgi:hypothetical protein